MVQHSKAVLPEQLCSLILKTVARDDVNIEFFAGKYDINDYGWRAYSKQNPTSAFMEIEYKHQELTRMLTIVDITIGGKKILSVYSGHPFIQKLAGVMDAKSVKLSYIGDTKLSPAQMAAVEYLNSINSR